MAAIGKAWADGCWDVDSWAEGAWRTGLEPETAVSILRIVRPLVRPVVRSLTQKIEEYYSVD